MSADAQPEPAAPKPKHHRLQFGLRTLLALVTLASIGLALIVVPAQRQRRAVAALRDLGGEVSYADEGDEAWFRPPEWLRQMLGIDYFQSVEFVDLDDTQVTDLGLEQVKDLTELKGLWLGGAVSDAGLVHLKGLTGLKSLWLNDTLVTDAGLPRLKALAELEVLSLYHTQVTDAGLAHLKALTQLKSLALDFTQVGDEGVPHLKRLTGLKSLWLNNTRVTTAGIAELRAALPGCVIYGP